MPERNLSPQKSPMPTQPPEERRFNFEEVALGYTYTMAVAEARRCLNCKNHPCVDACPVGIDIPGFIAKAARENMESAYATLSASTALPAVCGRVCPQESQCESACVRALKGDSVGIGRLERFVADWHRETAGSQPQPPAYNGHRVAVIGAGPSGLTCAGDLARLGYQVTIYEALHVAGGVLVYGIPEFRLPKAIVRYEIDGLKALGVKIETDIVIGRTLMVDDLFSMGFEALFIGTGAGLPRFLNIPGENLKGVYSANEYLTRVNLMKAYQPDSRTPIQKSFSVAVVGGGNVAMDAARCAMRMGADQVTVVYRRSMAELPARAEEVEHAQEEGIVFKMLTNPTEVLGDEKGWVTGLKCEMMALGEPDATGRRSPVPMPDSELTLPVDTLIVAVGTQPNPLIHRTTDNLAVDRHGCIVVSNENGLTSRPNIYAGGDAVTGAATVILAMGAGKHAAAAIHRAISEKTQRS